jgi:hypothetical protein
MKLLKLLAIRIRRICMEERLPRESLDYFTAAKACRKHPNVAYDRRHDRRGKARA